MQFHIFIRRGDADRCLWRWKTFLHLENGERLKGKEYEIRAVYNDAQQLYLILDF